MVEAIDIEMDINAPVITQDSTIKKIEYMLTNIINCLKSPKTTILQ